ncbi:MAG: hypothetical protein OXT67_00010 [Zetaproteobacteria bacterium]|nr:hypothetical protein [Zetaproteobacteria bacterium]
MSNVSEHLSLKLCQDAEDRSSVSEAHVDPAFIGPRRVFRSKGVDTPPLLHALKRLCDHIDSQVAVILAED